jgi:hypothetical protein
LVRGWWVFVMKALRGRRAEMAQFQAELTPYGFAAMENLGGRGERIFIAFLCKG